MTQQPLLVIEYLLQLQDSSEELFTVRIHPQTLEMQREHLEDLPEWTRLSFFRCPGCELSERDFPHCPAAANLVAIVQRCEKILSCDKVLLQVTSKERILRQETTAQKALCSLMGLVIAASPCPHTSFFKPMARFHLPLASEEETIFRATATYMLCQYFVNNNGGEADFEMKGLENIYHKMHEVNMTMAMRLRKAAGADSSINAIVLLDLFAKAMPYFLHQSLEGIRYLFQPLLAKLPQKTG